MQEVLSILVPGCVLALALAWFGFHQDGKRRTHERQTNHKAA